MALITCPECGKQISDKAKVCINCGNPIAFDKNVRITFEKLSNGLPGGILTFSGTVYDDQDKKLYSGSLSNIQFEIKQNTKISIIVDGMQKRAQVNLHRMVEPGKKYIIKRTGNTGGFMPCAVYEIVEVDVIDSD